MILNQKDLLQFKGIWHAIKIEHVDKIFTQGFLEARTTQRYWPDGHVYRDNQGDTYENSHYMKGWSMTRDRDYAFTWGCVILLLDWEMIKRDFKVKPVSWNYRIHCAKGNFGKEREEFVISNFMPQTFREIEKEYFAITDEIEELQGYQALRKWQEKYGTDFIEYWQRAGTRTLSLDKYLKGIFIGSRTYTIYKGRGFDSIKKHPLFKGFVSSNQASDRHSKSLLNLY